MKKNVALLLLMGLLMVGAAAQVNASPVPAISSWSSATADSDPNGLIWTIGFQFKANDNLSVTALGAYESNVPTNVGLWDEDGTLLASINVPSNGDLIDGFRYADLGNSVSLTAGQNYRVGASVTSWLTVDDPNGLVNTPPQISYLAGAFGEAEFIFPGQADETKYITANFLSTVVPVPSSVFLFGTGIIGLLGSRLKRNV